MRKQVFTFLTLVLAIYPVSLLLTIFLSLAPLGNILGFLSLLCYVATLLPSILRVILPSIKKNKIIIWLLKYRRHVGVAAFCLGLNHGILLTIRRDLDLLSYHTYIHYFQGVATLLIFTVLAFTSNDQAVKSLKKNWKKLHYLSYLAIFILPWHILDKMSGRWTYLTPIGVLLSVGLVVLFLVRRYKESTKTLANG